MKRTRLKSDREKARDWQRRSAQKYEDRIREESDGRFREIGTKRGVMERTATDPDRYGELFQRVRTEPCFGLTYLSDHTCGMGVRPLTAHHLGRKDSEGMVPVCPLLHDLCHDQPWKVREGLEEAGSPTLEELGAKYVANAKSS